MSHLMCEPCGLDKKVEKYDTHPYTRLIHIKYLRHILTHVSLHVSLCMCVLFSWPSPPLGFFLGWQFSWENWPFYCYIQTDRGDVPFSLVPFIWYYIIMNEPIWHFHHTSIMAYNFVLQIILLRERIDYQWVNGQ